jgi:hypothetical protein
VAAVEDLVASAASVASAEDSARRKTSVDQWNRLESCSSAKNTSVLRLEQQSFLFFSRYNGRILLELLSSSRD